MGCGPAAAGKRWPQREGEGCEVHAARLGWAALAPCRGWAALAPCDGSGWGKQEQESAGGKSREDATPTAPPTHM